MATGLVPYPLSPLLMLRRYRHVIWDWNGTLLDDLDLCVEVMNGMLRRRGMATLGRACLAELRIAPPEVLMIGDTIHDFEVAESLGVDCVLVAHGHHSFTRLAGTGAPVFADLPSLAAALGVGETHSTGSPEARS